MKTKDNIEKIQKNTEEGQKADVVENTKKKPGATEKTETKKKKKGRLPKHVYTGPKQGLRPDKRDFEQNMEKFVELHFSTDGVHKGMVPVKVKHDAEMKLAFFSKPDKLLSHICKLRFVKDASYYISANSFTKGRNCTKETFTLHNIVIDIDCHWIEGMTGAEFVKMLQHFVYRLEHDFLHEYGIPAPNTVVYTGRGLQLWWALEPISAICAKMYKYVADFLTGQVCRILDENRDDFPQIRVDKKASGKIAQLYRLPMTKNQVTGTYGDISCIHEKRLNLAAFCEEIHEYKKDKIPVYMHRFASGNPKGTADHREAALFELVRMRIQGGEDITGYRDEFLFCLYNSLITACDDATAMSKVAQMNQMFPSPLPMHEYVGYLSTSRNKAVASDPYLLKNASIISRLDIAPEEQRHIRLFAAAQETSLQKREEARARKTARNEKILKLVKHAETKKEIAEAVGCSESTVAAVLKKHHKKTLREKRHQSALISLMNGNNLQAIMRKTGYSMDTIRNLIKMIAEKGLDSVIGKQHTPPTVPSNSTSGQQPSGPQYSIDTDLCWKVLVDLILQSWQELQVAQARPAPD